MKQICFFFYENKYTDNLHKDIKVCKTIGINYIVLICTVTQAQFYISFLLDIDIIGCISHCLKAAQSFQAKKTYPVFITGYKKFPTKRKLQLLKQEKKCMEVQHCYQTCNVCHFSKPTFVPFFLLCCSPPCPQLPSSNFERCILSSLLCLAETSLISLRELLSRAIISHAF